MTQYGQDQYGTVQYGGGTQVTGTQTFEFSPSGQVTSAQDTGTNTFTFSPSGIVTSANDSGTNNFAFTATGTGDVVGIGDSGTSNFAFDPSGTVTSEADTGTNTFNFSASGITTFPIATTGVNWYLNRKDKDTYIVFNAETSNYPEITIGEETTFNFYIKDTAGFQDAETRYDRVQELSKYAGYAETGSTLESVYYTEPSSYTKSLYDTLLVKIEPGEDVAQAPAIWGLVTSIEDDTQIFGAIARVSLSLFVLGTLDDYPTQSDIESEFKV